MGVSQRDLQELREEFRQALKLEADKREVLLKEVNHLEQKIDRLNLRITGDREYPEWEQPPVAEVGGPSDG